MTIFLFIIFAVASGQGNTRERYVANLRSYEGTPYAAPGESGGVSCSTLARLARGDSSGCLSAGLRDGCGGKLERVTTASNITTLDLGKLQTGDLVILNALSGPEAIHTIAYLGAGEFIHADPQEGRVVRFKTNSTWSVYPVVVVRWKE